MRRVPTLPDVSRLHVCNLGLCGICSLLIEDRFGRCVIVQNEMNRTLAFLRRERLKREDVDVLVGEGPAELSKRSRLVFLADGKFLGDRHGRNLLAVYLGAGWDVPARCRVVQNPTPTVWAYQAWRDYRRRPPPAGSFRIPSTPAAPVMHPRQRM